MHGENLTRVWARLGESKGRSRRWGVALREGMGQELWSVVERGKLYQVLRECGERREV